MKSDKAQAALAKETSNGVEVAAEESGAMREDVVDWAGEDDVEKPLNWTNKRKAKNIVMICYNTFLTYALFSCSF